MLERFEAVSIEGFAQAGRTRPLILSCEQSEGEFLQRTPMVVKAIGLPEVEPKSFYCELLGNVLAREFGITTPKPCIVNLDPAFVSVVNSTSRLKLRPGLAVGTEYFRAAPFLPGAALSTEQLGQAALIYAYDLMVQNPDRRVENPNCATDGDRLIAFDFEMAFSFLSAIGPVPPPWKFSELEMRHNHLFKRSLAASEVFWAPVIESVRALTPTLLKKLCGLIPGEFGDYGLPIRRHLNAVVRNASKLELELAGSLL
jgi:hypothetical protein